MVPLLLEARIAWTKTALITSGGIVDVSHGNGGTYSLAITREPKSEEPFYTLFLSDEFGFRWEICDVPHNYANDLPLPRQFLVVGSQDAHHRLFVRDDGMTKRYDFKQGDLREAADSVIFSQFRAAEFIGLAAPDQCDP